MNSDEILQFCMRKGLLLDREVLNILSEATDVESAKILLERIKTLMSKRVITKNVFTENKTKVEEILIGLPGRNQQNFERLRIKLGLTIELEKEISGEKVSEDSKGVFEIIPSEEKETSSLELGKLLPEGMRVLSMPPSVSKKLEVPDFVKYFRGRFSEMKNIIQEHSELDGLTSINKIAGDRQNFSIIGVVSEKRMTKNKNMILNVEDSTGSMKVLVNANKPELLEQAEEIALDAVIGFKGVGNKEILFANEVVFPDARLAERKRAPFEEYALFIGDLHFGSKRFLKKEFLRFIDYLNGKVPNTPEVDKIKYLFIVGDIVTGVGNYPDQEKDLEIMDLEEQYSALAEILGKIRREINIIICPGNHDGVRLMEPQPLIDEKYAWPLYNLKNVFLVGNPANVKIAEKAGFSGFEVLLYHGFSLVHYANNVLRLMLMRAMNSPEEIMKYLLKHRHLAPTHASVQYFPSEKDGLLIRTVPDIFVAAHTHKSAVSYYNNILLISTSCWESMTPYQEKFGNTPDHCKVPILNLKTGAVRILDFE